MCNIINLIFSESYCQNSVFCLAFYRFPSSAAIHRSLRVCEHHAFGDANCVDCKRQAAGWLHTWTRKGHPLWRLCAQRRQGATGGTWMPLSALQRDLLNSVRSASRPPLRTPITSLQLPSLPSTPEFVLVTDMEIYSKGKRCSLSGFRWNARLYKIPSEMVELSTFSLNNLLKHVFDSLPHDWQHLTFIVIMFEWDRPARPWQLHVLSELFQHGLYGDSQCND